MKTPAITLLVVLALTSAAISRADDKELAQALNDASEDLAQNEWRDAQDELKKARRDFEASKDADLRAKYGFYQALVDDRRSVDIKLPDAERTQARDSAISGYRAYLELNPKSGGALNNLAQLLATDKDEGRRRDALTFYDRAVALNDARSDVYALNRARLQSELGADGADAALKYSMNAWKKDPDNVAAQDLTLSLLEDRKDPMALANYVRELNGAGQVNRAIDTALNQIQKLDAKREPLLIALVESLANPTITDLPKAFLASDAAKTLNAQKGAADIGAGVQELQALYAEPANPRGSSWWRRDFSQAGDAPGWYRGDAFLDLARALGDRCRRAGKDYYSCAEAYYRYALDFPFMADPDSFLGLVQIYSTTNRVDVLEKLRGRYESELFDAKMAAIRRGDKHQEYEFHLALGTMYSSLEKYQNPKWSPASAIYQLENAQKSAEDFNKRNPQADPIVFPTDSALLLSDAYVKTGQVDKAAELRVTTAEKALDRGNKRGAEELVNPQWRATLPKPVNDKLAGRMETIDRKTRL